MQPEHFRNNNTLLVASTYTEWSQGYNSQWTTWGICWQHSSYPDGSRMTRRFSLLHPVDVSWYYSRVHRLYMLNNNAYIQALYALVGSHESINPRNFRVLVSDGPNPTELVRVNGQTIRQAGLNVFTVLIEENRPVSQCIYVYQASPTVNFSIISPNT